MNLKELASFSDRLQCGVRHSVHSVRKMQDAQYSATLLPSVSTIAQRMFCGGKYTDHRTMVHLGVITCKSFANKMLSKQLNSFGKQCHTTYSEYIINVVISVTRY